jgi:large subunit ribosomal protein L4
MKLKVFSNEGGESGESEFDIPVFEDSKGVQAVKEVIVAQAANGRQGSANTKTRGEVRGGGKKPWRQKGTGRARAGSSRSPIWVGGGIVFGPKPRDYSKKINKKVRQLAFCRALFERGEDGSLLIVDSLDIAPAKTSVANSLIRGIAPEGNLLIVDASFSDTSMLAIRNLRGVVLEEAAIVSVTDLCDFAKIIITRKGMDVLVERAKGGSK